MRVLLVAPLHSGMLYIDAAKKMGIEVGVLTTNRGDYKLADDIKQKIDQLVVVENFTADEMIAAAKRAHQKTPFDGVAAGYEFLVTEAVQVAAALGVPGLDPAQVEKVRNKAAMRQALADANVRTVRFAKAGTAIDLEHVAKNVGFPAVVKPLSMAGSIGVVRVNDEVELLAAYEDIAANSDATPEFDGMPEGHVLGREVIVEELLVGTEFCVDGYVTQNGEITVFEFVKIELGQPPHFQEIGYTVYRRENLPEADALEAYLKSVVKAVNITVGPFHSEVMLTKDGPVLIEIASRLPGDHVPELTERATGISFAACALATLLGMPIPEPAKPVANVVASQYIIDPSKAGELYNALEGWEEITSRPQVFATNYEIQPGQRIPIEQDAHSRLAEIRFDAESIAEAEAFRKEIIETIRVS